MWAPSTPHANAAESGAHQSWWHSTQHCWSADAPRSGVQSSHLHLTYHWDHHIACLLAAGIMVNRMQGSTNASQKKDVRCQKHGSATTKMLQVMLVAIYSVTVQNSEEQPTILASLQHLQCHLLLWKPPLLHLSFLLSKVPESSQVFPVPFLLVDPALNWTIISLYYGPKRLVHGYIWDHFLGNKNM